MAYVPGRVVTSAPPIVLIGAGGHGKVLISTLRMLGREVLFATDDAPTQHGRDLDGTQVRGTDDLISQYTPDQVELVNGVGSVHLPDARQKVFELFKHRGYRFATIIHPDALIAPSAQIAQGAQVMAGTIVQAGALVGANTILNTRCSVDHDCVIGAHTHIAPGVTLSGNVSIGQRCHLGTGATVIHGITIGHSTLVGAGAVVVKDAPTGATIAGVPAKAM
ncbi:MAG: acetyltransferase [Planctomycetota bacterium]